MNDLINPRTGEVIPVHPFAAKFPMLPEAEHAELRESIRRNGLRNPIVTDRDGRVLDGRNRSLGCAELGIEPETVVYEGSDLAEYVIDCNTTRRHMSTGARAMATALVLAEDGRRENGRWEYGTLRDSTDLSDSMAARIRQAGVILDFTPDVAESVVNGDLALDAAFKQADEIRRSEQRDKVLEQERKKREKAEAKAEAERSARIVADLTDLGADGVKYLDLINNGDFTPAEAWAAYQKASEKDRKAQAEIERGWRDTCVQIAECVRYLSPGRPYGQDFLREFYPHESTYVADGLCLTRASIDGAIAFLNTIREGVTRDE